MSKMTYPYWKLLDIMQNAPDKNNVSAVLSIAQGQWKVGNLSNYQFSGLLRYAGEKVTTIK